MKINTAKRFYFLILLSFLFPPFPLHAQDYSSVQSGFSFTRNLGLGNRGQDVENLQCILGISSPTGYFGPITRDAIIQFQNNHVADVLTPIGLTVGTGYFGSATRNYINQQLSQNASSSNPTCPTYIPPESTPTPMPTPLPEPIPNPIQNPSTSLPTCPVGYNCVPNSNLNTLPTIPTLGQYGQSPYGPTYNPYQLTYANQPQPGTMTIPGSSNGTSGYLGYATTVDPQSLQSYEQNGFYYTTDGGGYPCRNDPVIQWMKVNVPTLFPWAQSGSGCRSALWNSKIKGAAPDSAHIHGEAIDFFDRNGRTTANDPSGTFARDGYSLVLWAIHNASVLGINQIIFNNNIYNSWEGFQQKHGNYGHIDHVHIGRSKELGVNPDI